MDSDHLLETAQKLVQPSLKTVEEYREKKHQLLSEINRAMLAQPDLDAMIGKDNRALMQDNHHNHIQFMESVFVSTEAKVLLETVLWVFKTYRSRQFQPTYWSTQLSCWESILKQALSETAFKEIWPYYQWMLDNIPAFSQRSG